MVLGRPGALWTRLEIVRTECGLAMLSAVSLDGCHAVLNRRLLRRPSSRVPLCFTGPGSKTFHHRHHRGNGLVGGTLVGTVAASVGLVYSCSSSTTGLSEAWSSASAGAVPCTSRIRSTDASVSTTPGRHGQGRFPEHTGHTRPGPLNRVPVGVWVTSPGGTEGEPVSARRLLVVPVALVSALGLAACGAGAGSTAAGS